MQTSTKYTLLIIALTILLFTTRLYFAYLVEEPAYGSYFTLMQGEHIRDTGLPLYNDDYSYQGRTYSFTPGFYYLYALITLLIPDAIAIKLLPNILFSLLVPLFYAIGFTLTRNRNISLTTAFFGAFAPALFTSSLNTATPTSLALPLLAALLLALLNLERYPHAALILTVCLALVSPWAWLLIPTYLLYLAILTAEKIKIEPIYLELGLVSFLFISWFTLVNYKEAIFRYGFDIVSNSLPVAVQQSIFTQFTLLAMIYAIGVVPLFLGSLALYSHTFETRTKRLFLVAAFGLISLVAALLRFLPLKEALLLLSLAFIVMAAPGLQYLLNYLKKTRLPQLSSWATIALLVFFILSSALPALTAFQPSSAPTQEELDALAWLRDNADGVIMARPEMGHLINYDAKRPYVADTSYLLINNADGILADIDLFYTSPSTVGVIELAHKYGITHIIIGPQEHQRYSYLGAIEQDKECFPLLYRNSRVLIHGIQCELRS